jgi:hypothetical protein
MKRVGLALCGLLLELPLVASARGVSPYLPLNLEPEIESQIERVMILADEPVMTRPIAAATVLDALQKAHKYDPVLCERVQRYLERYTHKLGITHASAEGAISGGAGKSTVDPNRYGMREDSHWDASAQVYYQPSDYLLVDAGAVAYEGKTDFTGSMISFGISYAQLDIGFRPHWFSPMTDSSMLMSTEAPTMPSVTLSNYDRIFGFHYELFAAEMSESHNILLLANNELTSGHPRLAGLHLDAEPANGWSIGASRLIQYGGGALGGSSIHDLFRAFFNPTAAQTSTTANPQPFGNQEASITSSLLFPGRVPFSFYAEYAGEDTSRGKNYLLGNSSLSLGIHFPKLWERFDLTLETTEWQNAWYTHNVYLDGMTNYGRVIGNWFGDQRTFGDGVGGRSAMLGLGYEPAFGGLFQLRYRTLQNQEYTHQNYKTYQDFSVTYSRPWLNTTVGGEVEAGRDVYGQNFTRLAGFLRYDNGGGGVAATLAQAMSESDDQSLLKDGELFVDAGANANRTNTDLVSATTRTTGPQMYGYHFALGARRFVSDHSDLGTRLEFDNADDHSLIGVRILDYRYRFNGPLALGVFLGADRFNLATPAYGIYYGAGLQWRNVIPGWDLGVDLRYANSIARDHLLPSDPVSVAPRNDSFYNILSETLSISRHF